MAMVLKLHLVPSLMREDANLDVEAQELHFLPYIKVIDSLNITPLLLST